MPGVRFNTARSSPFSSSSPLTMAACRPAGAAQRTVAPGNSRQLQDTVFFVRFVRYVNRQPHGNHSPWHQAAARRWGTGSTTIYASRDDSTVPEKWAGLSKEEILRRKRISEANRGKEPWNKGRAHSEATKEKIRQRTREAMQRPEVLEKLRNMPHPKHNEEIRKKISASLKQFYDAKGRTRPTAEERQAKAAKRAQERAAKARLKQQTTGEGAETKQEAFRKTKKLTPKVALHGYKSEGSKVQRSSTRSEEHKRKIADAIKRKWRDPEYRNKIVARMNTEEVQSKRMAKYQQTVGNKKEQDIEHEKALIVAEKRTYMKYTARTLVEKAEDTVSRLALQVQALHAQPAMQMRAQSALANARGVLKKARVQLAQIEMELTLAAEADGHLDGDKFEDAHVTEHGESATDQSQFTPPASSNREETNGHRFHNTTLVSKAQQRDTDAFPYGRCEQWRHNSNTYFESAKVSNGHFVDGPKVVAALEKLSDGQASPRGIGADMSRENKISDYANDGQSSFSNKSTASNGEHALSSMTHEHGDADKI